MDANKIIEQINQSESGDYEKLYPSELMDILLAPTYRRSESAMNNTDKGHVWELRIIRNEDDKIMNDIRWDSNEPMTFNSRQENFLKAIKILVVSSIINDDWNKIKNPNLQN